MDLERVKVKDSLSNQDYDEELIDDSIKITCRAKMGIDDYHNMVEMFIDTIKEEYVKIYHSLWFSRFSFRKSVDCIIDNETEINKKFNKLLYLFLGLSTIAGIISMKLFLGMLLPLIILFLKVRKCSSRD